MNSVTVNAQFAGNPAFLEYQDLLIQIQHALCRGDNQTANRLCNDSEDLVPSLSLAEVQWLQWLSSDLEMLCGEELLQPAEQSQEEYARSLIQSWLAIEEHPEKVLDLLRRNHGFLSQSRVAYARARAYGILGYKTLWRVFLQFAAALEPENFAYKIFLLDEAKCRSDFAQANELAEAIFDNPVSTPVAILIAAGSIYTMMREAPSVATRPVLGKLRRQVQHVLDGQGMNRLEPKDIVFGLFLLGGILEGLKRKAAAVECYQKALSLDSQADEVLVALGNLLIENDRSGALSLFERAVELRTEFALPYFHLALRDLKDAHYPPAVHLAEQVLNRKNPPRVYAFAHEVLAISEVGMAGLTDGAIFHFKEAVSLAPEIDWMRQNYTKVLELRNSHDLSRISQQARLMLKDFNQQGISSQLGIDSKEFLSERLTSLSISTSEDESSTLALAA